MAVIGHRQDLDPADYEDEEVGGRLSLVAHPAVGRKHADPAERRQDSALSVGEKMPESLTGSGPAHVVVTVGMLHSADR
jgi:hypothetical protein